MSARSPCRSTLSPAAWAYFAANCLKVAQKSADSGAPGAVVVDGDRVAGGDVVDDDRGVVVPGLLEVVDDEPGLSTGPSSSPAVPAGRWNCWPVFTFVRM